MQPLISAQRDAESQAPVSSCSRKAGLNLARLLIYHRTNEWVLHGALWRTLCRVCQHSLRWKMFKVLTQLPSANLVRERSDSCLISHALFQFNISLQQNSKSYSLQPHVPDQRVKVLFSSKEKAIYLTSFSLAFSSKLIKPTSNINTEMVRTAWAKSEFEKINSLLQSEP